MPPDQQPARPGLGEAVTASMNAQKDPNADASTKFLAQLDADAKLHGTLAYNALPAAYRARVEARALTVARTAAASEGGDQ
jgi:hypothetical protein